MRAFAYRRTAGAAVIATAVIFGVAATSGSAAETEFRNGYAKATAVVVKIAPAVGSLELAISQGVSVSEVRNDLAQSQAQALDLGLIGTTLTAEQCDGEDAAVTPDDLPKPERTDNRKGDSEKSGDEIPIAGTTLGYGREVVRATRQPLAEAITTTGPIEVPPVLSIAGGRSHATTRIVDKKAREALATVDASINLGGLVELQALRWEAFHRTGADPDAHAAFTIGEVMAAGVAIPTQDLGAVEDAVNTVLKETGLAISLPKVERFSEPNDLVRVTPLRVILKDSPIGAALLGPIMELTREQRAQLYDELAAAYCRMAGLLLVGDITLTIAGGSGYLAADIGGAEAISMPFIPGNPFGEEEPVLELPPPLPEVPLPIAVPSGVLGSAVAPTEQAAAAPTGSQAARPVVDIGPIERVCKSVHPFSGENCSKGAAIPLGILGLIATAGVAALDWRHQRARRKA